MTAYAMWHEPVVHIEHEGYPESHIIVVNGLHRFMMRWRTEHHWLEEGGREEKQVLRLVQLWDLRNRTEDDMTPSQARRLAREMCLSFWA
jgi:hypothetical protein